MLLALLAACTDSDPSDRQTAEVCHADEVPEAATLRAGWQDDGSFVAFGGRRVLPAGPTTILSKLPVDLALHPDGHLAYLTIAGRSSSQSALAVLDLDSGALLQTLDRDNTQPGILATDTHLYVATGAAGTVDILAIGTDGTLTEEASIAVDSDASGLALSEDGATLWAGAYTDDRITEIDLKSQTITRTIELSVGVWDLIHLPARGELYAADLQSGSIAVIDLAAGTEATTIQVTTSPAALAATEDGATVYAALSNGDAVLAIDTDSRSITMEAEVTGAELLSESGVPLGNSNLTDLWLDEAGGRLLVARGTDNAVSVIDPQTLAFQGAFPTAMYPTGLALGSDGRLVVIEYKGGTTAEYDGEQDTEQRGSATIIDLDGLDLTATTAEVAALFDSAATAWPFACDTFFPVPTEDSAPSPIEHVVLIVKENKTFDCLFGDLGDTYDVAADPEHMRWPAELTVNQRALIAQFNISDNFYVNSRDSDSGHLMLTSTHMTHYTEWMWVETARNDYGLGWQLSDPTTPTIGNFFTHLLNHDRSIQVYGEIVGMFVEADDGRIPYDYADTDFPGGPAYNNLVSDEEKALYVAEQIEEDGLADFTYLLLPNDHTNGTDEGSPTPESMVAANDRAVGIVVEAISSDADLWEKTAIFILQDDPQGCTDSVDEARSLLIVASPWAKRGGYVSHANADYLSVFATFERILDVPPMARPDAVAVPLWDLFTPYPDTTPFTAIARKGDIEYNRPDAVGAKLSAQLDLSGPDRSPELTPLLDAYMLYRMGRITRQEAEARLEAPLMAVTEERWADLEEEAEEEGFAFDVAWARYEALAAERGLPKPVRPYAERRRVFEEEDDE